MSCVVYLSYPPGTTGHPPDKDVILRLAALDGSAQRDLVALFGGQGTINVNSWAPDSRRFAYVACEGENRIDVVDLSEGIGFWIKKLIV